MKRTKHLPTPPPSGSLVTVAIVAFFVGFVVGGLVVGMSQTERGRSGVASSSSPADTSTPTPAPVLTYSNQVNQIAAWFDCPCSDNCGDALDTCRCNAPRGAIEIKNFIQTQLDAGKKEAEVIKLVQQKYGGLKPALKEKFKAL